MPVPDDPAAGDPVVDDPIAGDPIVDDPVADAPVASDAVAEEQVADDPVGEIVLEEPAIELPEPETTVLDPLLTDAQVDEENAETT